MQSAIDEALNGLATSGAVSAAYTLDLTASFVAATAPTKALIDTDIPGFQAAWRVDVTAKVLKGFREACIASGRSVRRGWPYAVDNRGRVAS